jgi:isocitrate lyase
MHRDFPGLPLFFNYSGNFKWYDAPLKFSDVGKMGYKIINVSLGALRASMKAVWDYAVDLKKREEQAEIDFEKSFTGHPMEKVNEFSGFPRIRRVGKISPPAVREDTKSIGLLE